ncbi:MAG: hypothetical protein LBR65_03465 [Culturomica sp.]|jgi:hypothetical protein|nr:hypothetical protein [Culturomica sp.]
MYRVIFFFLFASSVLSAQTIAEQEEIRPNIFRELERPGASGGTVRLKGEAFAPALVNLHIDLNRKQKTFTGYRIQIFSGNPSNHSMEQIQEERGKFSALFPDIPVYLNYYDPDFKIRIGNFHNKLESIPTLKRIRYYYPNAYPVKMEIPIRDLYRSVHPEEEAVTGAEGESGQSPEENAMF